MTETLGGFEKLMLLAVLRLGDGAYGAAIMREIEERTGREVSEGAVYVALRRLERRGLLTSREGDATPERGGRPKRFYELRPEGVAALRTARDEWDAMVAGVEGLLGEGA